ncbi:hypothetical protein BaRGS_00001185 [Batillaria attramentaria]|uniref:Uncharacterized protein n=1 Tax=Batillaria attramentaria TaxID=370345 RepID=A0ABD0M6B5_9CAEN
MDSLSRPASVSTAYWETFIPVLLTSLSSINKAKELTQILHCGPNTNSLKGKAVCVFSRETAGTVASNIEEEFCSKKIFAGNSQHVCVSFDVP